MCILYLAGRARASVASTLELIERVIIALAHTPARLRAQSKYYVREVGLTIRPAPGVEKSDGRNLRRDQGPTLASLPIIALPNYACARRTPCETVCVHARRSEPTIPRARLITRSSRPASVSSLLRFSRLQGEQRSRTRFSTGLSSSER